MKYPQAIKLLGRTEHLFIMHNLEALANIRKAHTIPCYLMKSRTENNALWLKTKMLFLGVPRPELLLGGKATALIHQGQTWTYLNVLDLRGSSHARPECTGMPSSRTTQQIWQRIGLDDKFTLEGQVPSPSRAGGPSMPSSVTKYRQNLAASICAGVERKLPSEGQRPSMLAMYRV